MIKCTILGCGGSMGVPQIGCECVVCKSDNPKNKRLRASILLESKTTRILVDASPDLRYFALKYNFKNLDAVIITHPHSDHFSGIDDLKPIFHKGGFKPIDTYMLQDTYDRIGLSYEYVFKETDNKIYRPILKERIINADDVLDIGDINIRLFPQHHGNDMISLGLRIGDFAYSTDVNKIPENSFKTLEGINTWVVDCLRYHYAPSHAHYEMTMNWIDRVKPKQAFLTHMAHEIYYDEISNILPSGVAPVHDGQEITINKSY
jgi:phosphoribosyl 1,2-cyclic phosphate phosphodiesterase